MDEQKGINDQLDTDLFDNMQKDFDALLGKSGANQVHPEILLSNPGEQLDAKLNADSALSHPGSEALEDIALATNLHDESEQATSAAIGYTLSQRGTIPPVAARGPAENNPTNFLALLVVGVGCIALGTVMYVMFIPDSGVTVPHNSAKKTSAPAVQSHIASADKAGRGNHQGIATQRVATPDIAADMALSQSTPAAKSGNQKPVHHTRKSDPPFSVIVVNNTLNSETPGDQKTGSLSTVTTANRWVINLISLTDQKNVERSLERLKKDGLNCNSQEVTIADQTWYRIYVQGFASVRQAKKQMQVLSNKYGYKSAWISKPPKIL